MAERIRTYAGIGSRQTPENILCLMRKVAARLANRGYRLRSGAAAGADAAFETGAATIRKDAEIFLPWKGFNGSESPFMAPSAAAMALTSRYHPAWVKCSQGAQKMHSRNAHQILGAGLDDPVDFVVCWTPDGAESEADRSSSTGGTGQAIALASRLGIPVFNLARDDAMPRLSVFLGPEWHEDKTAPNPARAIFVFGSNTAGRHGAGAALMAAKHYGAVAGVGAGAAGRSYAIPTKNERLEVIPLETVAESAAFFLSYARAHPQERFFVTRVGCGLAGYADAQVAPLFAGASANCSFAEAWRPFLQPAGYLRTTNIRGGSDVGPEEGEEVVRLDRNHPLLGNPHVLKDAADTAERDRVIAAYAADLDADRRESGEKWLEILSLAVRVRRGARIAGQCWCAPRACHVDVIRDAVMACAAGKEAL